MTPIGTRAATHLVLASAGWLAGCQARESRPLAATAAAPHKPTATTGAAAPLVVPRTWDEGAASWLLPLAFEQLQHELPPAAHFDAMPIRPLYRSYPVYAPGREPPGYLEQLRRAEPEILWDGKGKRPKLETDEDWLRAGELFYDAAVSYSAEGDFWLGPVNDLTWLTTYQVPVAKDGTIPFIRYEIRETGKLELGAESCAMCHTRVMPDGQVIKGTQGNFPAAHLHADLLRRAKPADRERVTQGERDAHYRYHASPWLGDNDPNARLKTISSKDLEATFLGIPPGVYDNHNGSLFSPARTANLIGIKHRRYLDQTGHHRHRGIADLMRFSDFHQLSTYYQSHGKYPPVKPPPDPLTVERASDEMHYALGRYLYSLEEPTNPNPFDTAAAHGKEIFARENCGGCHRGPELTNEMLNPVPGFVVPADHPEAAAIMKQSVGTDPTFAMKTRKGTGFYKVPPLRGLWHRGPFEHNGSVATLEDWFDPRRLRDDYVPTGWRGPVGTKTRAVKGHEFGLDLSADDRRALIAYLRTL